MHYSSRVRAFGSRAFTRIPAGVFLLAIAMIVLISVPIARAATSDAAAVPAGGALAQEHPIASETSRKPKISGKVASSRSVSGSAIRVRGKLSGVGHGKAHVKLSVRSSGAKKWRVVTSDNVRGGKKFTLKWRGGSPGRYMTKVSVRKFGRTASDRTGRVYVFRRSYASYFGPGLYGSGLACGGHLSPGTVGVAHKTLPCGTRVAFKVGNRVVTARVIDRGPYIAGRDWDLTTALKNKLGFGSTGTVYATR
jgi:hypothetical protein